jgi:hypothetical protein
VVGTTAAVATAGAATAAAASTEAAAAARAAAPPPAAPATVNVQVTEKPAAPAPQPAAAQKLEQLKQLLSEGLITQAQYQKASTEVLNEMVK